MLTTSKLFGAALIPFSGVQRESFSNPNNIITEAVRQVAMNVDIGESKKDIALTPAVYSGDNLYALPDDVNAIISLTPIDGKFSSWNEFLNRDARSIGLDSFSTETSFTTEYRQGTKLMRITGAAPSSIPITIHDCNSLSDDGIVTATADANSIGINEVNFMNGKGAVDFNVTPTTGTSTIVFDGFTAKNIVGITRDGSFSLMLYVPADMANKITSVRLRVGNNSSNYLQSIVTTNAWKGSFREGWNPVRFERRTASTAGTVNEAEIDYMEVSIVSTVESEVIGVKIDHILAEKGVSYALSYYSNNYYINSGGYFVDSLETNSLSEQVVFNNDTIALVIEEMKKLMDFELKGDSAGSVWQSAFRTLSGTQGNSNEDGLYARYRRRYLSERKAKISHY